MKQDIDPFADDLEEELEKESSRFGVGTVRQILKRWWLLLIFTGLGYVAALYYLSIVTPKNEAVAVLEVDIKTRQLMGEELESEKLSADVAIATEASKLMGPGILAATAASPEVQALQKLIPPEFSFKPKYWRTEEELAFSPATAVSPDELAEKLAKGWVEVKGRRNTSLIDVVVHHPDEESARVIADTLLKVYLEKELGEKKGGASVAYTVLKQESEAARKLLDEAEQSLQVYVAAQKLNEKILESRAELIALRQRYKAKHPKMIQAEAIYRDMYDRFRREIKRAITVESEQEYWQEHRQAMEALDRKIALNNEGSDKAKDEWLSLVQIALTSRGNLLTARIGHQQELYQTITKRMTEINVADETGPAKVRVVEPATVSASGEKQRVLYLAAGSCAGLMAGVGIAFLFCLVDYKIYDVRSLEEASGQPCLAAVPTSKLFDLSVEWQNVLEVAPNSPEAEALRNLRASVILLGKAERHQVILVTSSVPGEGKTTIASELAASFALNDQKTILIDLDLRKPRVHTLFPKLDHSVGMSGVLAGQVDLGKAVQATGVKDLHVICAGKKAPNPSELLHETELNKIISTLGQHYQRIIIDTPPVLPVSDTRLLVNHAQSVIMVVRALKAPVGAVLRAKDLLVQARAPLAGVVLNGMKKRSGSKYYGYKGYGEYGASGGYGGYYDDGK